VRRSRLVTIARLPGYRAQAAGHARVARVVRQDQDPAVGQQAAVQVPMGGIAGREPLRRHPQRVEKIADSLGGGQNLAARIETAQIDVQLSVRELVGAKVCSVHREGGLADPGGTVNRRSDNGYPAPA